MMNYFINVLDKVRLQFQSQKWVLYSLQEIFIKI